MNAKLVSRLLVLSLIVPSLSACQMGKQEINSPTSSSVNEPEKQSSVTTPSQATDLDIETRIEKALESFTPDTSPMPNAIPWIGKAKADDPVAQFVLHMMYRDKMADIQHIEAGEIIADTLDEDDMFQEMLRWRDRSAGNILTELSVAPSLFFSVKPWKTLLEEDELKEQRENYKEAIAWLEEAAKRGYSNAEYILGLIYWNGIIVEADKGKALELIYRAANHKVSNAQYHLGMMYELGIGVPADQNKSLHWLEKAIENNNKDAIFILAMKYRDGIGVQKDEEKAKQIAEKDDSYHAWTQISSNPDLNWRFDQTCSFTYDQGEPRSEDYSDCGDEEYIPDLDFMDDEEKAEYLESIGLNSADEYEHYLEDKALEKHQQFALDYSVDYALASQWLEQMLKNGDYPTVRMMRAQTLMLSGCRGLQDTLDTSEDQSSSKINAKEITYNLIKIAVDKNEPYAKRGMAQFYDRILFYDENNLENLSQNEAIDAEFKTKAESTNRAIEWYKKAAEEGDSFASDKLEMIFNDIDRLSEYVLSDEMMLSLEKTYQEHMNEKNYDDAFWDIDKILDRYTKTDNEKKILEWSIKQLDLIEKKEVYNYGINKAVFLNRLSDEIAKIFLNGSPEIRDNNKALHYAINSTAYANNLLSLVLRNSKYNKQRKHVDEIFIRDFVETLLNIGQLYDGTDSIPTDLSKAYDAYMMAISFHNLWPEGFLTDDESLERFSDPKETKRHIDEINERIRLVKQKMMNRPKLELQDAVEHQIKLEAGKDPDGFFAIKSGLVPCKTNYDQNINKCPDKVKSKIYVESVEKAMTAIVALVMAQTGVLNIEMVDNTIEHLVVINGENPQYRDKLASYSPVMAKIKADGSNFSFLDYYRLFNIWYLRQIPYAAKDEFKKLKDTTPWEEYLNQAEMRMKSDPNLDLRTRLVHRNIWGGLEILPDV